jgi:phosphomannomutase
MGVFKSYDIRGIYGTDWNADVALHIGLRLPALLGARTIGVGRDARLSSGEIFAALTKGITQAGADVADIGLCDTPAVYFATAFYGLDGSVMITASHNPPQYNGLKVSRREAVPVGFDTGLAELERALDQPDPAPRAPGAVRPLDIRRDYIAHLARFRSDLKGLRVVIDCSNGMAGVFLRDVLAPTGGDFRYIFEDPDGRFPNHAPNPLEEENLRALKQEVVRQRAALGICFDGDADRVMFVDESGKFVSPDLIIALLGRYYFRDHPEKLSGGSRVATYDVRSSRSVVEIIRELGGDPRICKVGHSFAKKLLRDTKGIVGGELAGHYYFRENFYCDSGMIAALIVLEELTRSGKPFSALVGEVKRYFFSGEINFTVPNGREILEKVRKDFPTGELTDLDGIRMDFPDWWFNLRVSNTEPLLRLVVEARTEDALTQRVEELTGKIGKYAGKA